jgi:repressor LexA
MSSNRSEEVGRLIRDLRNAAGITQEALAQSINCSKAQLSLMESGQRTVSIERARQIEAALHLEHGRIVSALQWQNVPPLIRAQVEQSQAQSRELAAQMREALARRDLKELRRLTEQASSNVDAPQLLRELRERGRGIPVINKVAAGYPAEFTDLDYPASIADEYITCPDVADSDAFAARVVGDSMQPQYQEGDIVIFSPKLPTPAGADCFVRLERDSQTTFKRIYFEDDGQSIRLQPLNNSYPPRLVPREDIGGMYAAAYVMRRVNGS